MNWPRYRELTKVAPLRHGVVTPNCQSIHKLSQSMSNVSPRHPTEIPGYPRGTRVSESETERARAIVMCNIADNTIFGGQHLRLLKP